MDFYKKISNKLSFLLIDIITILISYLIFLFILEALNFKIKPIYFFAYIPLLILFKIVVYFFANIYKILITYVSLVDILKIMIVVTITNTILITALYMFNLNFMMVLSLIFVSIIEMSFMITTRFLSKIIKYIQRNLSWTKTSGIPTLIVGAGSAAVLVLNEINRNESLHNRPCIILDDNPKKFNKTLHNIKIQGPIDDITKYIETYQIEEVIIAINNYEKDKLLDLIKKLSLMPVKIKKISQISDLDEEPLTKITEIKIEDLLNRDEVKLDDQLIRGFIKGEVVLVTGGGGSIGSELCRQISELEPKQLIIFDIYENNTYDIQMELLRKFQKKGKHFDLQVRIGSVYNHKRVEDIYSELKPTIVFHAAAYKHVPLMEDSAVEAVRTNVIGTYNVSSLASKYLVKKFVLVSSDKAVRSTNIMGATKRYAELIIQEQQFKSTTTKFSAVRFGNVLGSNGSVIPLFKGQIADGGPVTVTHPEITRYFMTIPESVGLIMQCGVYAKGGEIFILDMGEPVLIRELAEKMIRLAGYKPYNDIQIEYTGLRPGEKLYEELLVDHDNQCRTDNEKIYIEKQREVTDNELKLVEIIENLESYDNRGIKDFVALVIDTYKRNGD